MLRPGIKWMLSMIRWDSIIIGKYKISVLRRRIIRGGRGKGMQGKGMSKRYKIRKEYRIRRG